MCEACLEKARLRAARYKVAFPERVKLSHKQDYERHRERYIERAAEWAAAHPARCREIGKAWSASNPERVRDSRVASKANARARALGVEGELDLTSRAQMIARWGDLCLACGAPEVTLDHVVPLVLGGSNDISNLQPLCIDCNRAKNRKTTDYRQIAA